MHAKINLQKINVRSIASYFKCLRKSFLQKKNRKNSIKRSLFTYAFPNIKFTELLNKPQCEEIKHFALEFQTMQESRRMHRLNFCNNNDKDEGNSASNTWSNGNSESSNSRKHWAENSSNLRTTVMVAQFEQMWWCRSQHFPEKKKPLTATKKKEK